MRRKIPGMKWLYRDDVTGELWIHVQGYHTPDDEKEWINEWVPVNGEITKAVALRDRLCTALHQGTYHKTRISNQEPPTLSALAKDLAKLKGSSGRRLQTIKDFALYVGKWEKELGHLHVGIVTYHDVSRWWHELQGRETASAANRSLATLRATIEHGIRIGERQSGNPAKALVKARVPRVRERARLSLKIFHEILEGVADFERRRMAKGFPYKGHVAFFQTQVALASRGAEVAGLAWEDVDFKNKILTLHDTKTAPTLKRYVSDELIEVLREHQRRIHTESNLLMAESAWVFPRPDGERTSPSKHATNAWRAGITYAGYPVGRAMGWTPHDLRRLGIELLYQAGGAERDVMMFVGHHVASVHAGYLQRDAERLRKLSASVATDLFSPPSKKPK